MRLVAALAPGRPRECAVRCACALHRCGGHQINQAAKKRSNQMLALVHPFSLHGRYLVRLFTSSARRVQSFECGRRSPVWPLMIRPRREWKSTIYSPATGQRRRGRQADDIWQARACCGGSRAPPIWPALCWLISLAPRGAELSRVRCRQPSGDADSINVSISLYLLCTPLSQLASGWPRKAVCSAREQSWRAHGRQPFECLSSLARPSRKRPRYRRMKTSSISRLKPIGLSY